MNTTHFKVLKLLIANMISGIICLIIAFIVASENDFVIGYLFGFYYSVIAFALGFIIFIIFHIIIPQRISFVLKILIIYLIVGTISIITNNYLFKHKYISGWYILPKNVNISKLSNDNLYELVYSKNTAIRDAIFAEYKLRGKESNVYLKKIISDEKKRLGNDYIHSDLVFFAVKALCINNDIEVQKYINDISKSDLAVEVTLRNGIKKQIKVDKVYADKLNDLCRGTSK